jgi:hypothetical protein
MIFQQTARWSFCYHDYSAEQRILPLSFDGGMPITGHALWKDYGSMTQVWVWSQKSRQNGSLIVFSKSIIKHYACFWLKPLFPYKKTVRFSGRQ